VPENVDDPIIEFEDEFGRVRSARRSEVPLHLLPDREGGEAGDDGVVIQNPVDFFPVYEPSADRVAAIKAAAAEENNPLSQHYDASHEVRAKGAGFYQFSDVEEVRQKQMEGLRQTREETERTRQERGAVDLKAGEAEGMQADANTLRSRAIEKRKRDLEERRKAVEAKRRKLQNGGVTPSAAPTRSPAPPSESAGAVPNTKVAPNPDAASSAADSFLAALELDLAMNKL